jgi:hypothetical protein
MDLFPRSNLLAVGHGDGSIVMWNYYTGSITARLQHIHNPKEIHEGDIGPSPINNLKFINGETLIASDADGIILLHYGSQYLTSNISLSFKRIRNVNTRNVLDVIVMPNSNLLLLTYDALYVFNPNTEEVSLGPYRPNQDIIESSEHKRIISLHDPQVKKMSSEPAEKHRQKIYKLSDIEENANWSVRYDSLPCMATLQYHHNFVVKDDEYHKYVNILDQKYALVVSWGTDVYIYNDVLKNNLVTNSPLEIDIEFDIISVSWISPTVIALVDIRHKLLIVDPTGQPKIVQEYNLVPQVPSALFAISGLLKMKDTEKLKRSTLVYVKVPDYRKTIVQGNALLYTLGENSLSMVRILDWIERIDTMIKNKKWEDAFSMAFQFRDDEQKCVVGLPSDNNLRYRMTSDRIEQEIPHFLQHVLSPPEKIITDQKRHVDPKIAHDAGALCIDHALSVCFGDKNTLQVGESYKKADHLIFNCVFEIYHEQDMEGVFFDLLLEFVRDDKLKFIRENFLEEFLQYHLRTKHQDKQAHLIALDDALIMLDISNVVYGSGDDGPFSEKYLAKNMLFASSVHAANYMSTKSTPTSTQSYYISNLRHLLKFHGSRIPSVRKGDIILKFLNKYLQLDLPDLDVEGLELKRQSLEFLFEDSLAMFRLCTKEYDKSGIKMNWTKPSFYDILPLIVTSCFDLDIGSLQSLVLLQIIKNATSFMNKEITICKQQIEHGITPDAKKDVGESHTTALYSAVFLAKLLTMEQVETPTDILATENKELVIESQNSSFMRRNDNILYIRQAYEELMSGVNNYLVLKDYDQLTWFDRRKYDHDSLRYRNLVLDHIVTFVAIMLITHVRTEDRIRHTHITRNVVQMLLSELIFKYRHSNVMPVLIQNLQRMIVGEGDDQEPLFEVAKHMYANIGSLDDDQRIKMRVWYLRVFYPRYVRDVGAGKYLRENGSELVQEINKDEIERLVDPFIDSLHNDPEYEKALDNVIIWMQDTMRNQNATRASKLFMFKYIEKELDNYSKGQRGLREFCRANNLIYDELFNFYLRMYCSEKEPSLIKPFLVTHVKKIKSSNDTFNMVLLLCKDIPQAKAFLLEMKGDIHAALNEFIKEIYVHRFRLQELVIKMSEEENINEVYLHRKLENVDEETIILDLIVDDFDLVTENKFIFWPDRAYSDQEEEMRWFLQRQKMIKLPPISQRKRLVDILENCEQELPSILSTIIDLRTKPTFVYDRKEAEKVRNSKIQALFSGIKKLSVSNQTKTVMLKVIFQLLKQPTIPRMIRPDQEQQNVSLKSQISDLKSKLDKRYYNGTEDKFSTRYDGKWMKWCARIIEREEHDVLLSSEFQDIRTTVRNAIVLCQTNSDRNTLEDSQVRKLWEKLLDQFLWLMHELRNKIVRLASRRYKKMIKRAPAEMIHIEEGIKSKRARQAEELERLLAESDSESDDEDEDSDYENLSMYDNEIDDIEKFILDCRKVQLDLTREMEVLKKLLISEHGKPTILPRKKKKKQADEEQGPNQQELIKRLTELEGRITQKKQHLEYLHNRRDELEEEKSKRKREIDHAHQQVDNMKELANLWMQRCTSVLLSDILSIMIKYVDVPLILEKITKTLKRKERSVLNNQYHRLRNTVTRIMMNYRNERVLLMMQSDLLASDIFHRGAYFLTQRMKGISIKLKNECEICDEPIGHTSVSQVSDSLLDFDIRAFSCGHALHQDCCVSEYVRVCPFCHKNDDRNKKIEFDDEDDIEGTENKRKTSEELKAAKIERQRLELELRAKGRLKWRALDPFLERPDRLGTLERLVQQLYKKKEFDHQMFTLHDYIEQLHDQKRISLYGDRVEVMITTFRNKIEEIRIEYENNMIMFSNSIRSQSNAGLRLSYMLPIEYSATREKKIQKSLLLFKHMYAFVMPFEDKKARHYIKALITSNSGMIISNFSEAVTHVVCETSSASIKEFKKLETEKKLVIVPQSWITDCIKENKLLDTDSWQYAVIDNQGKSEAKIENVKEGNTVTHVKRIKFERAEPLVDLFEDRDLF